MKIRDPIGKLGVSQSAASKMEQSETIADDKLQQMETALGSIK